MDNSLLRNCKEQYIGDSFPASDTAKGVSKSLSYNTVETATFPELIIGAHTQRRIRKIFQMVIGCRGLSLEIRHSHGSVPHLEYKSSNWVLRHFGEMAPSLYKGGFSKARIKPHAYI